MSVLVDEDTRVVVQGITGGEGKFHTEQMLEYGTNVVAGAVPGRGGQEVAGVPVYDTVHQAVREEDANASVVFVPPAFAGDACFEALDADGLDLVVTITEGIPTQDVARVYRKLQETDTHLVGPNCPGLITPGVAKLGILPGNIFSSGNVGLVSRSGTLTYQVVDNLTERGLGQSTAIGIGGDPIIGTDFIDALELFEADPDTHVVAMCGEIGGEDEEEAARYIGEYMDTPVVGFIAGRTAPPGKRMGHAGAIVSAPRRRASGWATPAPSSRAPGPVPPSRRSPRWRTTASPSVTRRTRLQNTSKTCYRSAANAGQACPAGKQSRRRIRINRWRQAEPQTYSYREALAEPQTYSYNHSAAGRQAPLASACCRSDAFFTQVFELVLNEQADNRTEGSCHRGRIRGCQFATDGAGRYRPTHRRDRRRRRPAG